MAVVEAQLCPTWPRPSADSGVTATKAARPGRNGSHAERMCLARQLLSALRRAGSGREAVRSLHAAAADKDRHPGLRLARLHPPGLGPRGGLLFPPAGLLGSDRGVTGTR